MSVKEMCLGIYKESCVNKLEFPLLWIPQNVKTENCKLLYLNRRKDKLFSDEAE